MIEGVAGDGLGAEYAATVGGPEEGERLWTPARPRSRIRRKTAPGDLPPASAPRIPAEPPAPGPAAEAPVDVPASASASAP
eukprot:449840-Alexandrium_andersonii.AAC.1